MPIIFVHGVNNRQGPAYDAGKLAIQAFLQKHLTGVAINEKILSAIPKVWFPYWGDLATKFAWNMASLPTSDMQALGVATDATVEPAVGHLRDALGKLGPEPLTALAKKRLSLAVDVLTHLALNTAAKGQEAETADFIVRASAYGEANPHPPWLAGIQTDAQLISALNAQLAIAPAAVQAQGGFGQVFAKLSLAGAKFKQAVQGLTGKAVDQIGDFASTKLLAWSRDSLNAILGRFFGDVFIYMNSRGHKYTPGAIPKVVIEALDEAIAVSPNEPLVIIGHSMGGVIAMDLLGHFRPDIIVDLFISVGSQVAHFEEIKLYRASDPTIGPPKKATTPPNIRHWINVYDEVDIFSYAVDRVFDRVDVDARYDTQTYVIKAHSAYFEQDRFYGRLVERIKGLK